MMEVLKPEVTESRPFLCTPLNQRLLTEEVCTMLTKLLLLLVQ